jgi:hypothetical protein
VEQEPSEILGTIQPHNDTTPAEIKLSQGSKASAKDMGTMFTMELLTLAAGVGISVLSLSQLIRNYLAHTQGNRGFTDDLERFASHWREQEAVLDLFPVSAGRGRGRAAGARPRATRPR